jgi:hypothetical protein
LTASPAASCCPLDTAACAAAQVCSPAASMPPGTGGLHSTHPEGCIEVLICRCVPQLAHVVICKTQHVWSGVSTPTIQPAMCSKSTSQPSSAAQAHTCEHKGVCGGQPVGSIVAHSIQGPADSHSRKAESGQQQFKPDARSVQPLHCVSIFMKVHSSCLRFECSS